MIEPKLRFKKDDGSDFPDWEEKKLGDVCDTLTYGMNAAAVKFDGENKYIRITDIDDESHCYKNDELVSPDGELDNKYLVCENDILLARTGASVGKSYLYNKEDGKLYYAGFLIKAHVKSENSKFIFFQTLTDKWVKITSMRSGQPGINANEYSDFTMNVPSLPEQQKIADFLSTIDTVIEKQQATVSAWEERKKGVMQKLFSQEVRFKADDGSDFPELEAKSLFDICEYKNKQSVGKNYVGTENMKQNFSGLESLDEETEMKGVCYCKGDTLMSNIRPYLRKTWKADREGVCSTDVLVFHPIDVVSEYLHYLIASDKFISYVMTGVKGVKMPRGDKEHMMKFSIMVPSLPEQQKIADCLSALDAVIEKQKETLEKWQELKKGLLQQMFV